MAMVEEHVLINEWNQREIFFVAKSAIKKGAEDWLSSRPDVMTWERLKTEIVGEYHVEGNSFYALQKLQAMRPKADET